MEHVSSGHEETETVLTAVVETEDLVSKVTELTAALKASQADNESLTEAVARAQTETRAVEANLERFKDIALEDANERGEEDQDGM